MCDGVVLSNVMLLLGKFHLQESAVVGPDADTVGISWSPHNLESLRGRRRGRRCDRLSAPSGV